MRSVPFVGAALAAIGLVLVPSVAFAQTSATVSLRNSDCGGALGDPGGLYGAAWADFNANGEIFTAYDNCPDNHSAVIRWKVGTSSTIHSVWDHSGAGGQDPASSNETITDGTKVHIQACTGEYSTRDILSCTPWGYSGAAGNGEGVA